MKYGPNPFDEKVTIRIEGNEGEVASIQVTNFTGNVIEQSFDVPTNTDYQVWEQWPKGIYVIRATINGKTELIRIVKK